jgi:hypothetical protein
MKRLPTCAADKESGTVLYADVERAAAARELEAAADEAREVAAAQDAAEGAAADVALSRLRAAREHTQAAKVELLLKEERLSSRAATRGAAAGGVLRIGGGEAVLRDVGNVAADDELAGARLSLCAHRCRSLMVIAVLSSTTQGKHASARVLDIAYFYWDCC